MTSTTKPSIKKSLLITTLFKKEKNSHLIEKSRIRLYCFRNITSDASYLFRKTHFLKSKYLNYLKSINLEIYQLFYRFKGKPKSINFLSNSVRKVCLSNIPQAFAQHKGIFLIIKLIKRFKKLQKYYLDYGFSSPKPSAIELARLIHPLITSKNLQICKTQPLSRADVKEVLINLQHIIPKYLQYHNKLRYVELYTPLEETTLKYIPTLPIANENISTLDFTICDLKCIGKYFHTFGTLQNFKRLQVRYSEDMVLKINELEELLTKITRINSIKALYLEIPHLHQNSSRSEPLNSLFEFFHSLESLGLDVHSTAGTYANLWSIFKNHTKLKRLSISASFAKKEREDVDLFAEALAYTSQLEEFSLVLMPVKKFSVEYSITPTILRVILSPYTWLSTLKVLKLNIIYCSKEGSTENNMISKFLAHTKQLTSLKLTIGENFLTSVELCFIGEALKDMKNLDDFTFTANYITINEKAITVFASTIADMKLLGKLVLKASSIKGKHFTILKEAILAKYKNRRCHLQLVANSYFP